MEERIKEILSRYDKITDINLKFKVICQIDIETTATLEYRGYRPIYHLEGEIMDEFPDHDFDFRIHSV